jgi:glycosyltransferase involved in cell wall biosynthesis
VAFVISDTEKSLCAGSEFALEASFGLLVECLARNRTDRMSKHNVLVSAYACAPTWGSEIGMGWNWVTHLAKYNSLTVMTESAFQEDILCGVAALPPEQQANLTFHFIDIGEKARNRCWNQGDWRFYRDYRRWQLQAYQLALQLTRQRNFDLSHQLNMIGYREPGFLWQLPLPFVWGPVGGFTQMPWRYLPVLGWRGAAYHTCRNILNLLQSRLDARPRKAAKKASAVLAATPVDCRSIESIYHVPCRVMADQGGGLQEQMQNKPIKDTNSPFKVVWVGKIVSRKCLELALYAIGLAAKQIAIEFHIVGNGEDMDRMRVLANKLGIDSLCIWYGSIPHLQALSVIRSSDCMLISSLQEGTPAVIMEALGLSVPVVCHDTCGLGAAIDNRCGIKIPLSSPEGSKLGLASSLVSLAENTEKFQNLRNGAAKRAIELSWDQKALDVTAIYTEVLKQTRTGQ